MFCERHSILANVWSFVQYHWTTSRDLDGLARIMATRSVDELAELAWSCSAWLTFHLAKRLSDLAGPRLKQEFYEEIRQRIADRTSNSVTPKPSADR